MPSPSNASRRIDPRGGWYALGTAIAVLGVGCQFPTIDTSPEAAAAVREQDLGTLPYHPLVVHLDLSILAYQLYGQSLVWPFDPYYEDAADREVLKQQVWDWVETTADEQRLARSPGDQVELEAYRGPGMLGGFENNEAHDPIIFQYSRLHPWSPAIQNAVADDWIEYKTPDRLTDAIAEVWVCTRAPDSTREDHDTGAPDTVSVYALPARRDDADADARDILMVFEGGTGDKGEPGQPASQSLMGFALIRATDGDAYDLHIAFRGSRSGLAPRAAFEAFSTDDARGNPDWITDFGFEQLAIPTISTNPKHKVSRGMATSLSSIVPQLFGCLDEIGANARTNAPTNIYLTGHSLGGALAQHFASAILLGELGPDSDRMPQSLRAWPWEQLKLITFGAPRVGNNRWAKDLTEDHLDAEFYDPKAVVPFDSDATGVTNLDIIPRLTDPEGPAAYRVLIPTDLITSGREVGGHVGKTVYLEKPKYLSLPTGDAHEPLAIRKKMTDTFRDDRIPLRAWGHIAMEELNPDRDGSAAGSTAEYEKLAAAVRNYYEDRGLFFDVEAYDAGVDVLLELIAD